MKKSDLKNGDIVLNRNWDKFIVLRDSKQNGTTEDLFIDLKDGCYVRFDSLNEDLTSKYLKEFDIIKVCSSRYVGDNIRRHILENSNIWTWTRKEKVKEMTIEEISEALGYEVKVVKGGK